MQRTYVFEMITIEQRIFSGSISAVPTSAVHNFKDLKQDWISQDFSRNLKVRKDPIDLLYKASALLLNFHMYIYGVRQIQEQYSIAETTLECLNI